MYRLFFFRMLSKSENSKNKKFLLQSWMCILFKILMTSEGILAEKRGNALKNVPNKVYSE